MSDDATHDSRLGQHDVRGHDGLRIDGNACWSGQQVERLALQDDRAVPDGLHEHSGIGSGHCTQRQRLSADVLSLYPVTVCPRA